jgi:hypothetical protein
MSANQPPFPSYGDQQERTGSPSNKQSSQLFPPQLRVGRGQTTGPFSGAFPPNPVPMPNNAPTNASLNPVFHEDATQAFQPPAYQPSPFQPSGSFAPTGPFQPGPSHMTGSAAGPGSFAPGQFGNATRQLGSPTRQLGNTGMLPGQNMPGDYSGDTGMLTLNQAVKVVRIPVAGKPGEFKTGILPVLQQPTAGNVPPPLVATKAKAKNKNKLILFTALILLVVVGSVSVLLLQGTGSSSNGNRAQTGSTQKNNGAAIAATANAQATATAVAEASLLVSDPLSSNIHNWPTGQDKNSDVNYAFKNDGYHIRPDGDLFGYAIMGSPLLPNNYTYTLTMQSVNYNQDDANALSFYGMIVDYKNYGNNKASFYFLRVNNGTNISYEFDKFDGRNSDPWQQLYPDPNNTPGTGQGNGKEFRGKHQPNVYSITSHDGTFTFRVNNVKIGSVKDTTFTGGELGMCVNQKGTDIAFTNLLLLNN